MSKKIKKRVFKGAVIGLSALFLTLISLEALGSDNIKPSKWFNSSIESSINTPTGSIIKNVKSNGITLFSEPVNFSDDGSTLSAETYTITATVYPSEATNKSLTGALNWTNSSSSWASNKTVTDYVTLDQTSPGIFTLSVLQAFGEQITLTVTSEDNPDATASCTIDYVMRVQSASITLSGSDVTSATGNLKLISCGSTIQVGYKVTYGTGTIRGVFNGGQVTTTLSNDLFNVCKNATTSGSWQFSQSSTAFIYANLFMGIVDTTVGSCTKFISDVGNPGTGKSQWTTAFYNFVNNNTSAAHATLTIPYTYSSEDGKKEWTGTASCGILFRPSSVEVTTASVTLDQSSIYV